MSSVDGLRSDATRALKLTVSELLLPRVVLSFTVSPVNTPVVGVVAPTVPLMLIEAVPVRFVTVPLEGVPRAGVTRAGELANTSAPEPVSSLITPASSAEVVAAKAESLSVVTTKVLEAGMVVPLSVVVLDDDRLVNAPVDGLEAPIAVFVMPTAE